MRFLYLIKTELWGRRDKVRAGRGIPGTSEVPVEQEKPFHNGKTLSGPK